jgi:hypothetical protein
MREPPLRILVVLYIVLATANLLARLVAPASAEPDIDRAASLLDESSTAWLNTLPEALQLALAGSLLLLLLLHALSVVGLFLYRRWGRTLGVATTFATYALRLFLGASFVGPVEIFFYDLATLAWGGALALAFWSSEAERFSSPAAATNIN